MKWWRNALQGKAMSENLSTKKWKIPFVGREKENQDKWTKVFLKGKIGLLNRDKVHTKNKRQNPLKCQGKFNILYRDKVKAQDNNMKRWSHPMKAHEKLNLFK